MTDVHGKQAGDKKAEDSVAHSISGLGMCCSRQVSGTCYGKLSGIWYAAAVLYTCTQPPGEHCWECLVASNPAYYQEGCTSCHRLYGGHESINNN